MAQVCRTSTSSRTGWNQKSRQERIVRLINICQRQTFLAEERKHGPPIVYFFFESRKWFFILIVDCAASTDGRVAIPVVGQQHRPGCFEVASAGAHVINDDQSGILWYLSSYSEVG